MTGIEIVSLETTWAQIVSSETISSKHSLECFFAPVPLRSLFGVALTQICA